MEKSCLEAIYDRRSVVDYTGEEISQETLDQVLKAALRASGPGGTLTGGYRGSQPFSIIVVRDPGRRKKLNEMLCEGRKKCIEAAPVSLIFCVDTHRLNRWTELEGGTAHFKGVGVLWVSLRAAYTAAQNAVIAAESLGLGSQYVQEIVWQPYTTLDFFTLPKGVLPVAMLLLGYPAERPGIAPSLPLEAVVHEETYDDPADDALVGYFAEKEEYFQKWMKGLPADSKLKKHMEEREVTNLAQFISLVTYTESFYKWRDDMVRMNLVLSELD
ncbi:nitroreductase family protein [bacterium]|nr:nitroreductase family protein [bacterium]